MRKGNVNWGKRDRVYHPALEFGEGGVNSTTSWADTECS